MKSGTLFLHMNIMKESCCDKECKKFLFEQGEICAICTEIWLSFIFIKEQK